MNRLSRSWGKRSNAPVQHEGRATVTPVAATRMLTPWLALLSLSSCPEASSPALVHTQASRVVARHHPQKPWASATEEQLRAFRGAISTVRLKLPYGPRPGQDDNVLFTPTYPIYGAEDRARMRAAYRCRGYTHWAIGPVSHRRALYHDQYPPAPFDGITAPAPAPMAGCRCLQGTIW
jgi:hypothetical protein